MMRRRWTVRVARVLLWLVPGTTVLGSTSCAKEFRDGLIDAGVSFVSSTATEVLQALFPIADWVTAAQSDAAA